MLYTKQRTGNENAKNAMITHIVLYKLSSLFPSVFSLCPRGKLIIEALQASLVPKFDKSDF